MAFSPDGLYVITGSQDNTVRLWAANRGEEVRIFRGHTGRVDSVSMSSDGRHVLSGSIDGTERFWDVATGDEIARLISLDQGQTG